MNINYHITTRQLLQVAKRMIIMLLAMACITACKRNNILPDDEGNLPEEPTETEAYPGVPKSTIYEVTIIRENEQHKITVFQNSCPEFSLGYMDMQENDRFPLDIFAGRSINWTHFSFSGSVTVEVKVVDPQKVPVGETIKVWPSRHGVSATAEGNTVRFTLTRPGQYSVEIGENGYKNGLVIFADPPETDVPGSNPEGYALLDQATAAQVNAVPASYSGVYFRKGVHDIGVYRVPSHIKNIYFEDGSWVYGSLIMDGNPNVKIFGRGVLSSGRLKYRESHCIEAINQSNNIHIEGIVVADPKYFAVRLIGQNNTVKWTKVIGGWVYNCDGIAAYAGSTVSDCFIWANDDAIKVYRDNITWSDCVVWQLNNGGVIQMAWGGSNATNVHIRGVDVLRAEWNKPGFNRALLSCVGNRYQEPGKSGSQQDWVIEDVTTETPIPIVFNVTPDPFSPNTIHGLNLKNWDVKMPMDTEYRNTIVGNDPDEPFNGFVFDNFQFNGTKLTPANWLEVTDLVIDNLIVPEFK